MKMRTSSLLGCWFIVAQYFITTTLSVPNNRKAEHSKVLKQQHVMTGSQIFKKTNAIKRKLTKSPSIVGKLELLTAKELEISILIPV